MTLKGVLQICILNFESVRLVKAYLSSKVLRNLGSLEWKGITGHRVSASQL